MVDATISPQSLGTLLLNSTVIALAVLRHGRIVFANPAFIATFQSAGSLLDICLTDIVVDALPDVLADALATAETVPTRYFGTGRRASDVSFDLELCLEPVVLDGQAAVIAFASDVTDQNRSREQLAYLAYNDPLTGLANRALFADRLHQAVLHARRHGAAFAVLMLDLDGFKAVNDSCGHDVGDLVLQLVGQRFLGCVRSGDTLARIGGDEFAVLLPALSDHRSLVLVAHRLIDALRAPLDFGAQPVTIGVSIGSAVWPEHAESVDALLAMADAAMYGAKRSGKNQYRCADGQGGPDIAALPPLAWSAAHAIGVAEIDDQHMHLAGLIDRLSAALKEGLDEKAIQAGLTELISYAAFHFATEEQLMRTHQVPETDRHREEHRRLLHDIQALRLDGDVASISLILRYLQEWLLRHVDGPDKQLGQALIARGCR